FIEELSDQIKAGFQRFLGNFRNGPPEKFKPVLVFISSVRLEQQDLDSLVTSDISLIKNPHDINDSIKDIWSILYGGKPIEENLFSQTLEDYQFDKEENKCPTRLIEHACEKLKVPPAQIIKVS
ncbi:MAG: hypothetical protein AAGK97_18715, partial [Bacteroidota bacterium]